jgi:hypothetical protein
VRGQKLALHSAFEQKLEIEMPRVSAAALSVVVPVAADAIRRPDPPAVLTPSEAAEWRVVVNRMSADWFPPETHALLVQHCRLLTSLDEVALMKAAVKAVEPLDVQALHKLIRTEQHLTRTLAVLSTKMRLNQASTRRQDTGASAKPSMQPMPWDRKPRQ